MSERQLNQNESTLLVGYRDHTKHPKCPKCHVCLVKPPRLESLQRSTRPEYIAFDTKIDRSVLLCRNCAYIDAQKAANEITAERYQTSRKALDDKIEQARELLLINFKEPIDIQDISERLQAGINLWEDEKTKIAQEEAKLMKFNELKNDMFKLSECLNMDIFVADPQLKMKLQETMNVLERKRLEFEDEWYKKSWMPYWAIWGRTDPPGACVVWGECG